MQRRCVAMCLNVTPIFLHTLVGIHAMWCACACALIGRCGAPQGYEKIRQIFEVFLKLKIKRPIQIFFFPA